MRRKRRKLVVTITETWTFVFDEAGQSPVQAGSLEQTALIPVSLPDAASLATESPVVQSDDASAG